MQPSDYLIYLQERSVIEKRLNVLLVEKKGKQNIKIYVNQTGIVLDQMALIPEHCPYFYEIPNKQ